MPVQLSNRSVESKIPSGNQAASVADGLNPLKISHIARTISFKIIGRYKIT
jgi:hypothetical protein